MLISTIHVSQNSKNKFSENKLVLNLTWYIQTLNRMFQAGATQKYKLFKKMRLRLLKSLIPLLH